MKTMKLWRNILVMTAAFSLASCSSGDDTDIYVATELSGTWQKVYDEGVADAGMVQYTFTSVALTVDCDIRRLTSTQMIWNKPGTSEEIARFTKEK